jgi:hypothetical protein
MNSVRHGMTAESWTLPWEPAGLAPERLQEWVETYKPASPAARHLLKVCVQMTLTHDRCFAAHTGGLVCQGEEVNDAWHAAREQLVDEFMGMLHSSPASAVAGLKRTGHGCRQILTDLAVLADMLQRDGYWSPEAAEHAVRLFGFDPALDRLALDLLPYRMVLYNLHCHPRTAETQRQVAELSVPERRPAELRGVDLAHFVPPAAECRGWLERLIAAERESVALLEEAHRTGKDRAGYERVMARAGMLGEGETPRLWLRYTKEANSIFVRNHRELMATLKRDAQSSEVNEKAGSSDPGASTAASAPAAAAAATTVTTPPADPTADGKVDSRNEPGNGATATTATTLSPGRGCPKGG